MLNLPIIPPRIIPSLLLMDGAFVKTRGFNKPTYVGDPVNTINLFNKFEVDEIVLLDITATENKKEPDFDLIEELASECWVPLTYGGGIKTKEQAQRILNSGVEKVLFESLLFDNPSEIRKAVDSFGASSVVACLNIKKGIFGGYNIYTRRASRKVPLNISQAIELIKDLKVGEVLINDISSDGLRRGYDTKLIATIAKELQCPVVALGGASQITDFKVAIEAGAHAAAAGSFFVFQKDCTNSVLVNFPERTRIEELFNDS